MGSLSIAGMVWELVELAHLDIVKYSLGKNLIANKPQCNLKNLNLSNEVFAVWIISTHSD